MVVVTTVAGFGPGWRGGPALLTLSVASLVVFPPAHPEEGEPCTAMAGAWGVRCFPGLSHSFPWHPAVLVLWSLGGGCQSRTWRSGHRFGGGHWSKSVMSISYLLYFSMRKIKRPQFETTKFNQKFNFFIGKNAKFSKIFYLYRRKTLFLANCFIN